ncbi:MAG: alkaline phosphatase D family protein [Proteobacteria bacterium]|nr:alkaline phosphatase D family protein [Pseudomonadota bacterium]
MPQAKLNKPCESVPISSDHVQSSPSSQAFLHPHIAVEPTLSRRGFVGGLASMSAVAALSGSLAACSNLSDEPIEFRYGVASGDPLSDRVILWTHVKPVVGESSVSLQYEVASDLGFTSIVSSGNAVSTLDTGFTVKIDALGLSPGKTYYYRFRRGEDRSPVGTTRTLPDTSASEVRFAVLSCSNYPAGYFNVYAEVAKSDAQYAIHLGDYIYEYASTGYASEQATKLGRVSDPGNEILSLADYRKRYAQYRSDADLQALHAKMPMIAVWDDHEIANDAWKDGAENHDPAKEGAWSARKTAALAAYHEWMPIRTAADRSIIYRSFDFGNLLSLHMLDTRLLGRDQQIPIEDLAGLSGPAKFASASASFTAPTRQLLGVSQSNWLNAQMAASKAAWQVLGQQVLMARMEFPASVLATLNPSNTSAEAQAAGAKAVNDYLTAKATRPADRTPLQAGLMDSKTNPKLGYNLDAWDGYIVARESLLGAAAQLGKKLISLAGDTHNAWHSKLTLMGLANPAMAGMKVGEEFATSSVSSPGIESYLSLPPAQIKAIFEGVVDDLRWMDPSRRGYLKMIFTATEARGEWYFVSTVTDKSYTVSLGKSASYGSA